MGETEFVIEPGRQDIIMTRVFDASRDVVFKAFTDPDSFPSGGAQHATRPPLNARRSGPAAAGTTSAATPRAPSMGSRVCTTTS